MKRKRGPAPRGNKRKHKRELEEKRQQSDSEVGDAIDEVEESFHGFSSGDEEEPGSPTLEDEDKAATAGSSDKHTAKKTKKSAPSKEELMDLLLRSSPFQSNLFKLQTEELLAEVRVKYDKMTKLEIALHQLKEVIMAIPTSKEQLLHEFEVEMKSRHKIKVPFPSPAPSKEGLHKFKFLAPSSVKLVGSYALKATSKTSNGFVVDVSVAMPDDIFQDKDFLDHRYFYKRACYIASLAAGIQASNLPVSLNFELVDGDQRKPCLVLSSIEDGSDYDFSKSRARIRILPAVSRNLFPAQKLLYTQTQGQDGKPVKSIRCNIRTAPNTQTPLYNNAILSDSTHIHFLTQIYNASQICPALLDAAILGKQWLRQRGFSSSFTHGGFGSFEWTWFVSYLLRDGGPSGRNVLEPAFSSFQLFRGALNSLAIRDRVNDGIVEGFDECGVNVFYKMTPTSYLLLQHEARRTLSVLNESGDDVFTAVFTAKVDVPVLRFDLAATITIPTDEVKSHVDNPSGSFLSIRRITSLLRPALTDRATLISVMSQDPTPYPISSQPPEESSPLTLGLLLDPEISRRTSDYGPPQNDDAAKPFRELWGSKTSVRRVKDGRILEAVQWDVKSTEEQYGIVKRIIRYILALHISAGVAGDIHFLTPTLFPFLAPPADVTATFSKTDGDAFLQVNQAYESFVRQIRDLKDVPLHISAVIPLSPGLTQTSVSPPYPQNFQKLAGQPAESYHVPSHQVVAQLEGSGKWPDDLRAIQKVKIGFLLQIAREMEKHRGVTTHVGLENPDADISNTGFLDVVYDSGHAFRVRLQQDPNHREATLMERVLKNKSLAAKDRTRFEGALKRYREYFVYGAAHAQALHALRGRFYFLPHTIRLVKRWLAAHLLSPQVSERTMELIVCSIFLHPQPFVVPASAEVGFLRTLKFLATWDWKKEPLIVDLDESISKERQEKITEAFEGLRKQDPGVVHSVWAIYPSYETNESLWTKDRPSKAVAARITALAKSSLQVVSKDSGSVKQIFTTPYTDYDFLIHLKKEGAGEVKGFKNLRGQNWKDVLIDFDPYEAYLGDLESCFGDAILWFYDNVSKSVIAGLWNPHVAASRPWKVALGYSSIPAGESLKDNKSPVVLNKAAVLAEIARLGAGLISSIDTKH